MKLLLTLDNFWNKMILHKNSVEVNAAPALDKVNGAQELDWRY